MTEITVVKRDGTKEPLNISKWQNQIANICRGVADVSQSMIEIKSQPHFYNNITTKEIDEITLRAIVDLINVDINPDLGHTNYQFVAGKQRLSMLRKDVYQSYDVPSLYSIVQKNIRVGLYTSELLDWYTEAEWNKMDEMLDHTKDEAYSFAAIEQLIEKYLVRNRATKQVYESPQIRYIVAAATVFHAEKQNRLKFVKEYYNAASDGLFTLATPVLAGLGTPTKQFSSCVLIKVGDSLDSIFASGQMMAKYASKRAGIGLDVSRIRSLGAPIRNGEISHTGILPFLKKLTSDLKSCCLHPEMYVEILDVSYIADNGDIHTDNPPKKILLKDLKVGDYIKSMDPNEHDIIWSGVENIWNTIVKKEQQVKLEFINDTVINCSTNHPIMILVNGNIEQKYPTDLTKDDLIIADTCSTTHLKSIVFNQDNDENYIDITVSDTNTFFTADSLDSPMVLTHNSQGGLRHASATTYYQIWTLQFEDLIVLKNNQGTEETRVRHMDYGVVLSSLFWKRFKQKGNITFFDPNDVPDLYDAFYRDIDAFDKLYEKYEKRNDIRKKVMSAEEVFKSGILKERSDTNRIYLLNIDNVQKQGPFNTKIHPIYQSNLCCVTGTTYVDIMHDSKIETVTINELHEKWIDGYYKNPVTIRSYDESTDVWKQVLNCALTNTVDALTEIEFYNDGTIYTLRCTPDHKIYTNNRSWIPASDIQVDDTLLACNNVICNVTSLSTVIQHDTNVFDLTVDQTECFYANGVLVHNCEIMLPTVEFESIDDDSSSYEIILEDNTKVTLDGNHQVLLTNNELKSVCYLLETDEILDLLV
jgi:hypothetical protein